MNRYLIVNADDGNLTEGIAEAVLDAHARGIVTSTTIFSNHPTSREMTRSFLKAKKLGIGLHLNLIFGFPAAKAAEVKSLIGPDGRFKGRDGLRRGPVSLSEIVLEFDHQIQRFRDRMGRLPTHLDTHHHLHDRRPFWDAVTVAALRYSLPIRRCRWFRGADACAAGRGGVVHSTDYLFGNLNPEEHWTRKSLTALLENLPQGIGEIVCHPGKDDAALRAVSSFTRGREKEWRLFGSPEMRKWVRREGIILSRYGL